MKKIITLIATLLCFAAASYAQDGIDVTLLEQLPSGELNPRSQTVIPISCYVISSTIYVFFSEDIGEVDVTLEEAFEGIILQTTVDSSEQSALLPFSRAAGEYTITFSLRSGSVFYGCFEL